MKPPPTDVHFQRFTEAMKKIMSVSKVQVQERIAEEKKGKRAKRPASPGPAASSPSAN